MAEETGKRRRGGGRAGNTQRRGTRAIDQMPWRLPVNLDKPTEPLSEEGINAIHEGAMCILEDIGIAILNDEARDIFKAAGCSVDGDIVRMGRDFIMEMLSKAPETWTLTPRNPDRQITVGGKYILFGNVSSPSGWITEPAKRCQALGNVSELLKLSQYFNRIHFVGGYPVEPVIFIQASGILTSFTTS